MTHSADKLICYVIPCYNEVPSLPTFFSELKRITDSLPGYRHEFIFVDDGSTDNTPAMLQHFAERDQRVRVVSFSKNFGKEIATSAGIAQADCDAVIILDADGQHPPKLIPEFIAKWEDGAEVVIGVRNNSHPGFFKKLTSRLFYALFNYGADWKLMPGATDYRLISRAVRIEFLKLTEHNRMTRALIDWLGFQRSYVSFAISERQNGSATYGFGKLVGLALNSFVSMSLKPLFVMAYAGFGILLLSITLALFSAIEMLIGDPMRLRITGTAYLVMLVLFLLGIVLISQGVLALYISHIHTESKNRPLYVINHKASRRLNA